MGSDQGLHHPLEPKRNRLVQQLSIYRNATGFGIIVVFDGWRSGWLNEVKEKRDGVDIIYSRQGDQADNVIVRIAREKGSGCVVVTSDREVRNAVEKCGAVAIYSGEFCEILRNLDRPFREVGDNEQARNSSKKGNPRRLSKSERRRKETLQKLRSY